MSGAVRLIRCVGAAAVSFTGELRESVPPSLGEASSPCSRMGSSKRNPPAPGPGVQEHGDPAFCHHTS